MANIKIRKYLFHDQKRGKAEDFKMAVKLSSYLGPGKCVTEMEVIKQPLLIPQGGKWETERLSQDLRKYFK